MSKYVWWVQPQSHIPSCLFGVKMIGEDLPGGIGQPGRDLVKKAYRASALGEMPDPDCFPISFVSADDLVTVESQKRNGAPLRPFFGADDFHIVAGAAIPVFEQFDLGQAYFEPVKLFELDGATQIHDPTRLLIPSNIKVSFLKGDSPNVMERMIMEHMKRRPSALRDMVDDEVVLSNAALAGPDIWTEKNFTHAMFLSDRLVKALKDNGLWRYFDAKRAIVKT